MKFYLAFLALWACGVLFILYLLISALLKYIVS